MPELLQDPQIKFSVFELDARTGELRKAGTRIKLQDQPLKILQALLERPGDIVTREELKRRIWPNDSFGDFDHAVNVAVAKLRVALCDSAEVPRFVETLPRRGYRFIFPLTPAAASVDITPPPGSVPVVASPAPSNGKLRFHRTAATVLFVIAGLGAFGLWFLTRQPHALSDKDTIVLADFTNTTGDPVFDGTLRQGLSVQLEQSPFLNILSDSKVRETLLLMGSKPGTRLTPELAREVCLRSGSAALLTGSVSALGSQYVLGLQAVNCRTGDSLVSQQATAKSKEQVLGTLADSALQLRSRLGESLRSVQKFNMPVEQVTTPSLEALQVYSAARSMINNGEHLAASPYLEHAIQLDPNFAMAYASLGVSLGSSPEGIEYFRKAYDLRDRVSERERYYIEAHFDENVTGDLEKARNTYERWTSAYPRDDIPQSNLGVIYSALRMDDKALEEAQLGVRDYPSDRVNAALLVAAYLHLNRLEEARTAVQHARAADLDSYHLRYLQYELAFLRDDARGMAEQADWATGKLGAEDLLLGAQADTAAYTGHLADARKLFERAIIAAQRADRPDIAAAYQASRALREALFGNSAEARARIRSALVLSGDPRLPMRRGRDVRYAAALVSAWIGNTPRSQSLADDLVRNFPEDTVVRYNYSPVVEARLALDRKDAGKAIALLEDALPVGQSEGFIDPFFPSYVSGEAHLMAGDGRTAAAEFRKILDHPGLVLNCPTGALARLGLARAYVLENDPVKARAAYQDFLGLWKDGDPDLPLLKQAKAEFDRLK